MFFLTALSLLVLSIDPLQNFHHHRNRPRVNIGPPHLLRKENMPNLNKQTHLADEQLELYALNRLSPPEKSFLEQHCLTCIACLDHLLETVEYIDVLRSALVLFNTSKRVRWVKASALGARTRDLTAARLV